MPDFKPDLQAIVEDDYARVFVRTALRLLGVKAWATPEQVSAAVNHLDAFKQASALAGTPPGSAAWYTRTGQRDAGIMQAYLWIRHGVTGKPTPTQSEDAAKWVDTLKRAERKRRVTMTGRTKRYKFNYS
ncbi:MAG: hypothetical protein ABIQ86_07385 [Steroidobacteraceae bacterium]